MEDFLDDWAEVQILDHGLDLISKRLERETVKVIKAHSLTTGKRFSFCYAMGQWSIAAPDNPHIFNPEDCQENYPTLANLLRVWEQVQDRYGWSAIPSALKIDAEKGKVQVRHDW